MDVKVVSITLDIMNNVAMNMEVQIYVSENTNVQNI